MNALLNLIGIIKKPHGALPDQRGSRLIAPRLKLRGRSKTPYPELNAPYSAEADFQCQYPKRQIRNWYFWKPGARAINWAFTRRCATTGSRVMLI